MSGLTGAIDLIDEELYNLITPKVCEENLHMVFFEDDMLSEDIRDHWLQRGYLTLLSHDEERNLLRDIAAALHEARRKISYFVIAPELDCNYRCIYCFEKHLQTESNYKSTMDEQEVSSIYNIIDTFIASGSADPTRVISLFGGEPLMAKNKDIVFHIIEEGVARGFTFDAVTNGHDLDAFLPVLGSDKLSEVQVTIDGPKLFHDQRRLTLDGSSSYDKLINNIRRALNETDVRITIRVNLDETNILVLPELIEQFRMEGWWNRSRISVNMAIVYHTDSDGRVTQMLDSANVKSILQPFLDQYINLSLGSTQSSHSHIVYEALENNTVYGIRSGFCGATTGMYVFQPDGVVNSCWLSVGSNRSRIGSYSAGSLVTDDEATVKWFGRNVALIPECLDCKYCLVCAGGCPQYAESNKGTLYAPHCEDFKESYGWVLAGAVEKYLREQGL